MQSSFLFTLLEHYFLSSNSLELEDIEGICINIYELKIYNKAKGLI